MEGDAQTRQLRHRSWPIRWLVWLAILAALVAWAWINGQRVPVRPFGSLPLNQAMAAPLVIGLVLGWTLRSRLAGRAARAAARRAAEKQA
jgi:hypothetical protein